MEILYFVYISALALAAGAVLGYLIRQKIAASRAGSLEAKLAKSIEEAKSQAKETLLEAKNKAVAILEEAKSQEKERLTILLRQEERLHQQGLKLDKHEAELARSEKDLENQVKQVQDIKIQVENFKKQAQEKLEKVAGLKTEEAKAQLIGQVEKDYASDLAQTIQKMEKHRREEIEKKAQEIITTAIQRYARSNVAEITSSIVNIPNDELKGRIIGKEGRNIRTLEKLTGVEVIVDETPESIMLSSFDPIRREIAKTALQKLVQDGRIQPARIEEKVEEAKKEIQKKILDAGEAAAYEVGVLDLPKEIVMLLGRLAFRTSFGQNVLVHSIEMAHVSNMLARELGLNAEVAKKAALLHDVGKAVDHEIEGTHLELGRKILQKYNVDDRVVKAMQSHHDDYPYEVPEAFIVTCADIISGARPGARRDTVENYIKRLTELENLANSFDGIEKSYAIQAGREIRIFVTPDKIDDYRAMQLARDVAKKIESELKYPGEIKVNVIRETRAIEYAR